MPCFCAQHQVLYMRCVQQVAEEDSLCCPCRRAVRVKSQQAWHAAVRHTGLLFQLHPFPGHRQQAPSSEAPEASTSERATTAAASSPADGVAGGVRSGSQGCAASSLPYPQLQQTISSANFAPAAHLAEHYSPPGGGLLACVCCCMPV